MRTSQLGKDVFQREARGETLFKQNIALLKSGAIAYRDNIFVDNINYRED